MTNEELYELVKGGAQPMVRVLDHTTMPDETVFSNGMIGRVLSVELNTDFPDEPFYIFRVREDEFREVNEPYMERNWYDFGPMGRRGEPVLNYIEAAMAPDNGIEGCYCMPDDTTFELMDNAPFVDEYLKNGTGKRYTEFLEEKVELYKDALAQCHRYLMLTIGGNPAKNMDEVISYNQKLLEDA